MIAFLNPEVLKYCDGGSEGADDRIFNETNE
jgi:hypothetical protein